MNIEHRGANPEGSFGSMDNFFFIADKVLFPLLDYYIKRAITSQGRGSGGRRFDGREEASERTVFEGYIKGTTKV